MGVQRRGGAKSLGSPEVCRQRCQAHRTLLFTTERMYQDVNVPAGTTELHLKGQRWFLTDETGGNVYDDITISIRDTGDNVLQNLRTWSNLDASGGWLAFDELVGSPYAGQTIRVHIEVSNDASNISNFLLDTLALEATVCL